MKYQLSDVVTGHDLWNKLRVKREKSYRCVKPLKNHVKEMRLEAVDVLVIQTFCQKTSSN